MTFTPDTSSEAEVNAAFVADFARQVRERRDKLLLETDYIHLPDVTVSDLSLIHISEPTRPY